MADDTDRAAVLAQGVEDVEHVVEGLGVEGAEALVDEQGLRGRRRRPRGATTSARPSASARETTNVSPPREGRRVAGLARPVVAHDEAEAAARLARSSSADVLEGVALVAHPGQPGVGGGDDLGEPVGEDVGRQPHLAAGCRVPCPRRRRHGAWPGPALAHRGPARRARRRALGRVRATPLVGRRATSSDVRRRSDSSAAARARGVERRVDVGGRRLEQRGGLRLVEHLPRGGQARCGAPAPTDRARRRLPGESTAAAGLVDVTETGLEHGSAEGRRGLDERLLAASSAVASSIDRAQQVAAGGQRRRPPRAARGVRRARPRPAPRARPARDRRCSNEVVS